MTQLATAKAGLILVNINPAYRTHELDYALNKVGCRALVTATSFKTSDYLAMLRELGWRAGTRLPRLEHGDPDRRPAPGTIPFAEVAGRGAGAARARSSRSSARQLQFDDPINIQFTSGTTGAPKGATLTHHNILNNGFFIGEAQRLTPEDRVCIPVPLYHCFGMVLGNLACLTHGAAMVYPGGGFDPLRRAADRRRGALHRPLRRAHHVHRRARPSRVQPLRPLLPAHRDHGGLALPDRGDAPGGRRRCTWRRSRSPTA